jgi:hypothetical protein
MSMINEEIIKSIKLRNKTLGLIEINYGKKNAFEDVSKGNNGRGKFKFPSKYYKVLSFVLFFIFCEVIHHK